MKDEDCGADAGKKGDKQGKAKTAEASTAKANSAKGKSGGGGGKTSKGEGFINVVDVLRTKAHGLRELAHNL